MPNLEIITDGGHRRRWSAAEKLRIVEEKLSAVFNAEMVAEQALFTGQSPIAIAEAARRLIARAAAANSRRLSNRGRGSFD